MPSKPAPACPVCRRLNCMDATHKTTKPAGWKATGRGRPAPSWTERRRRRAVVAAWVAARGNVCPACGNAGHHPDGAPVQVTADHVVPVALGGAEDGELQPMCRRCQNLQASRVAAMRRRAGGGA